jgi:hypothetical protein
MSNSGLYELRRAMVGAVLGLALGVAALPASAASYNFNLSGNVGDGTSSSFFVGSDPYQIYELLLPIGQSFTLTSGDDVTLNLTLDGPLTVPSGNQFLGFNLKTDDSPTNIQDNGTMTLTGGDANTPVGPQGANFSGGLSNVIFTAGPAYSFTGFSSSSTFTFDGGPITINELSISYQVDNPSAATPLPAALPMFAGGAGLIGFVASRRKRKAASI